MTVLLNISAIMAACYAELAPKLTFFIVFILFLLTSKIEIIEIADLWK